GDGQPVDKTMLTEEAVAGAEARAGHIEAVEARPSGPDVAGAEDLAGDAEVTLQGHLAAELGKGIGGPGQEQVADSAKGDVDAESILELVPEGLAEDRQLDVGRRPPLGADAAPVAERAAGTRCL